MMKQLALGLLIFLPMTVAAQNSLLNVPGMAEAIAEGVKASKAIGLVTLQGDVSVGAWLPIRTLHDSAGINYVEAGIGGDIKKKENARPLAILTFDASAIFRKVESLNGWYQSHVVKQTLPDFWAGPTLRIPFPGEKFTWKGSAGISISLGF